MPRTKKPAGQAVDRRNGRQAELHLAEQVTIPPTPTGLKRVEAVALWAAYWGDTIAGLVQPAEIALVERWVRNVDRYRVLMDVADAEPLVEGSMGQMRANPAYDLALKIEAAITRDEAQLGYGPKNRASLGIAVVQQRASLADLNNRYGGGSNGGHDTGEEEDPRLALAE
jgi:hypothetical protein